MFRKVVQLDITLTVNNDLALCLLGEVVDAQQILDIVELILQIQTIIDSVISR